MVSRSSLEDVLCLLDARTGSFGEVRLARPNLLRICAYEPGQIAWSELTAMRILLVADLLARVGGLRGMQVFTAIVRAGPSGGHPTALELGAEALGIHPPATYLNSDDGRPSLDGLIDVHVIGQGSSLDPGLGGILLAVAPAAGVKGDGGAAVPEGDLPAGQSHDPLAVRLALMSFPYHQPAELTADLLASARETLRRWRHRVAEWAESPSMPVPDHIMAKAGDAFDGLDTASALKLLQGLMTEDSGPLGARFEAFLLADRVLGLELAREIGQPRG